MRCHLCNRKLLDGETAWATDWRVIDVQGTAIGFKSETRYTCDECEATADTTAGKRAAWVEAPGGCGVTTLCFIDTETTGLDARIHQPYEVCLWPEDVSHPLTAWLEHDLTHADQQALNIGRYWERNANGAQRGGYLQTMPPRTVAAALVGVTLVGSNPAFDATMLTRYIGAPVWHHRLINVAEGGMWVFGWDRPKGLADVANECRERGYDIPRPDHTAEGDVRTTRAVYEALRAIRAEGVQP